MWWWRWVAAWIRTVSAVLFAAGAVVTYPPIGDRIEGPVPVSGLVFLAVAFAVISVGIASNDYDKGE